MPVLAILAILLGAVSLEAAQSLRPATPLMFAAGVAAPGSTVTVLWDANTDGVTTGYLVFYGLMAGSETEGLIDTALRTSTPVANLLPGRRYFFHVRAYDKAGLRSDSSVEVQFQMPADPCAFPLGATSVSIFPTGKLNKTGSGGPGSGAFISFRAFSPNSPIVYLAIRANGVDIPDSVASGDRLASPGSLWFTIPQVSASYSIFGRNLAGCTRDQPTGFSSVP